MNNLPNTQLEQSIRVLEQAVDSQLEVFDSMKADDILELRRKRIEELKRSHEEARAYRSNGHGGITDLNTEKEIFDASKNSTRVIVLFHTAGSAPSDYLYQHLRRVAETHMESRFLAIEATKASFLAQRLNIRVLPTLVLIKANNIVKKVVGLDDFSTSGTFTTRVLEQALAAEDVLTLTTEDD